VNNIRWILYYIKVSWSLTIQNGVLLDLC